MNGTSDSNKDKGKGGFFRTFLITFIIALLIRFFIAQPFIVNGQSMEPTFGNGEYLIVDELTYRFREPERGEVIIFRYPQDTSKFFIKRIIGLPEETIEVAGGEVYITKKDGTKINLVEPYIEEDVRGVHVFNLGAEEYYVMGDNRGVSSDSRKWGPVLDDLIIGRAIFRFFPVAHFGIFPGDFGDELIK